jgi:beta-galactosidase
MARIYGHTWPVRWGEPGRERVVKVYSNCPQAELFLNGTSCGVRHRDSQDFPAAGLRWRVRFEPGENHLAVTAQKEGVTVSDEITLIYQTEAWGEPARLALKEIERSGGRATVQATLLDDEGVLCLDARNGVRFGLAGDGFLIDNLGTSTGSRTVQAYNGRARISVQLQGGRTVACAASERLPTEFLRL